MRKGEGERRRGEEGREGYSFLLYWPLRDALN